MNDPPPSDIAPRPRPGFRSRRDSGVERVRLFAGMLRTTLGCVGFFASLLYLPIQMATPVLAGVSLLMVVTGATTVWRAVADAPQLKLLPRAVAIAATLVVLGTVVGTMVLGAGALGPLNDLPPAGSSGAGDDGTVRFEAGP